VPTWSTLIEFFPYVVIENTEMSPESNAPESPVTEAVKLEAQKIVADFKEETTPLAKRVEVPEEESEWQQILSQVLDYLSVEKLSELYRTYRKPIVTLGVFLGAIIALRVALAVLSTVNEIPLLQPTFEIVGIGYSAWFIYRYLLQASKRKDLVRDINTIKNQVLGDQ
jgi:hypothetical protein